jgi:flavin reductase (DIM6/NTAB) family NADH-FMN oxidoreductase RutF
VKQEIGTKNCLYPLPTTLVGALVNGRPNYITIAHIGVADPGSVAMGIYKTHYTTAGIKENKAFSVNLPSERMVKETDYCGLVSGKNTDKSTMFKTFYGKTKKAPMIEECPVNMECELVETVDMPNHYIFIGKIVATYCDDEVLKDDDVDFSKLRPILFVMTDRSYWTLGSQFAKAWSAGRELKEARKGS